MISYAAQVKVRIKPEVNDPQGLVILESLKRLGFDNVSALRANKLFELKLTAASQAEAEESVRQMCAQLLAQPIMENSEIVVAVEND